MFSWLQRAKEGLLRLLKKHRSPSSGSQEFTAEPTHDHALVLYVTEPKPIPRWRQIRFLSRVLTTSERRLFLTAWILFFLGAGFGTWGLIRPHLLSVPAEGGMLREGLIGSPKLINPLFAPLNDVDRDLASLIYSGLFRLDQSLEPQLDLAQTYRWTEQNKTLEVKIREGARFHDGVPVTADDVVFTYQEIKNPNLRSPLAMTMRGVKILRVDDQTVQFQLEKPSNSFLHQLTVGILPAHVWEQVPDEGATIAEANLKPIGSGPYALNVFTRDSRGAILAYRLRQFSGYYGPKPYIKEREFRFYGDRQQAEEGLKSNQIDALAFIPWSEIATLKSANSATVPLELPQTTVAFFHVKNSLLKDERVRTALGLSLDPEELAEVTGIHGIPVTGPFPFLQTTTTAMGNMEEARKLLEAANWKLLDGQDVRRLVTKTSTSTVLAIKIDVPNQPDLVKIADLLKRRWSLLGAQVDVNVRDPGELLRAAVSEREYQVLLWNILLPPNQDLASFWESSNATDRGLNFSNITDRDVDKALDAVRDATSTQTILSARQKLQRTILDKNAALFLVRPTYGYIVSKRIKGVDTLRIARPSDRLTAALSWYVDTDWKWK